MPLYGENSVSQFTLWRQPCLYTATHSLSLNADKVGMDRKMIKDFTDVPLSESNVSLKLADIQERCSQLLSDSDELGGLSLEDPVATPDNNNPYNRG